MKAAFGPVVSNLAQTALDCGAGERFSSIGVNRHRLERAAGSAIDADRLSSRETAALAYAAGFTGRETALLTFGTGYAPKLKPVICTDRMERLTTSKQSWWAEPSSRVSDLGDESNRRFLSTIVGLDLNSMTDEDPLTVPADARYAALAKLELGEHWELLVGLKDQSWIAELDEAHQQEAQKFLPLMTREDLVEQEQDDDAYHLVPVSMMPIDQAILGFGHGVSMVLAAEKGFLQIHVHQRRGYLHVVVSNANERWMDGCRGLYKEINVHSLAEVGTAVLNRIPSAAGWRVVGLKFPSHLPRVQQASEKKGLTA